MEPNDHGVELELFDEVCDGCGGPAVVAVALTAGVLTICSECWSRHGEVLRGAATAIRG